MKNLISLFLFLPLFTTAQINMDEVDFGDSPDLDFFQALDTVFGALDKSKIPSGILLERSLRAVEVEKMDGKHPDYIVIRDSILQLCNCNS